MVCPKCKGGDTQVNDSRDVDEKTIRRRRECEKCHFRFTTYERFVPVQMSVAKTSGRVEPFDREKIIRGISIAANGRVTTQQIERIADEIEMKLIEDADGVIASKRIGNLVIKKLKKFDEVTYLRFASVYKNFQNLDSFEAELEKLKK